MEGIRPTPDVAFAAHRPELVLLARRITGSPDDAQDVVQDVWLRWSAHQDTVSQPAHWLRTVTRRASIDLIRARQRHPAYPLDGALTHDRRLELATAADAGPCEVYVQKEAVASAIGRVLECLSPLERIAFLGRSVFELDYPALARHLCRYEPAVRQLCHRAVRHLAEGTSRYHVDPSVAREVILEFHRACEKGTVDRLFRALRQDCVAAA
jgi:RNA polymerase sigma-70 factor (ECF subfamily)